MNSMTDNELRAEMKAENLEIRLSRQMTNQTQLISKYIFIHSVVGGLYGWGLWENITEILLFKLERTQVNREQKTSTNISL